MFIKVFVYLILKDLSVITIGLTLRPLMALRPVVV